MPLFGTTTAQVWADRLLDDMLLSRIPWPRDVSLQARAIYLFVGGFICTFLVLGVANLVLSLVSYVTTMNEEMSSKIWRHCMDSWGLLYLSVIAQEIMYIYWLDLDHEGPSPIEKVHVKFYLDVIWPYFISAAILLFTLARFDAPFSLTCEFILWCGFCLIGLMYAVEWRVQRMRMQRARV